MAASRFCYVLYLEKGLIDAECIGPFEYPHQAQEYIDSLPPNYARQMKILTLTPVRQQNRIATISFHSQV